MYQALLRGDRYRPTTVKGRTLLQEYASDRGRIILSSPFRRLQQKAQVFPLESNAAVRSRLTHSLEVANIGTHIATLISDASPLLQVPAEGAPHGLGGPFVTVCESACLLHDLGNPPFGHFGESAIRHWFSENGQQFCKDSLNLQGDHVSETFRVKLLSDFMHFDGNAQGFRIVTRLQGDYDKAGLNLTLSLLSGYLKYVAPAYDDQVGTALAPFRKKAGYFFSEEDIVKAARSALAMPADSRHPAAFVMEAADDIAYCLSDMEDAVEKRVVTEDDLREEITKRWIDASQNLPSNESGYLADFIDTCWREPAASEFKGFQTFRTKLINALTKAAAESFTKDEEAILAGKRQKPLFFEGMKEYAALSALKMTAIKKVFRCADVVNVELAGHQAIEGLLDSFGRLLRVSRADFERIAAGHISGTRGQDLAVESRLFSKLPHNYYECYVAAVRRHVVSAGDSHGDLLEWHYRAHLLVDYIASMTDDHALRTFQTVGGILVDGRVR